MGSKALIMRCINSLTHSNKQCSKYLSTTASQCKDLIVFPKTSAEVFSPEELDRKEKLKKGLITVEGEENAVGIVSGVPEEHIKTRTVRIYMPPKNAMQSGSNNINFWQISFDTRERWENPLMGWCSSGDPLQALRVDFATKEEAIEHCKNMGWKYIVQKPNEDNPKPRSYGTNFSWDKRTRVSTK